jgi:6-phosphogluconolactonase
MATEELALVGTYTDGDSDGIYTVAVDEDGAVEQQSATAAGENPSFLAIHPSGEYCYAVNEIDDGAVTALSVDQSTGELTRLNQITTGGGADPCHCTVDATGQYLLVAHYTGGSVAMCPIADDGGIREPSDLVQHSGSGPNEKRQEAAHPHSIQPAPDNEFAYVPDLGDDRIVGYELDLDAGELVPSPAATVNLPAGSGPRHMEFDGDGAYAYLINELDSTVTVLERDADTGGLTSVDTARTVAADYNDENITADIHVHPSGEWVFGSNRGHDSIATFAIDDGEIAFRGTESTRGEWPRNFALTPDGEQLLAENMETDDVVTFDVDASSGELSATGAVTDLPSPVCLQFL